jgi:hypothetical protein
VKTFLAPNAPLILLIDGTLERRWGKRIAYKGRFHDAVRSTSGHVQTSEGIHWLCVPRDAQRGFSKRAEKRRAPLNGEQVILCHTEKGNYP